MTDDEGTLEEILATRETGRPARIVTSRADFLQALRQSYETEGQISREVPWSFRQSAVGAGAVMTMASWNGAVWTYKPSPHFKTHTVNTYAVAIIDGWLSIHEVRRIEGVRRKATLWDCVMLLAGRRPNL